MSFRKLVAVVAAFAALSANAQFWRDPGFITSGGAFTGGLAGPDGGCPTPTYGFSSETLGFYKKASQTIAVCAGGVPRIAFSASSIAQSAAQSLVWSNNNNDPTATVDLSLFKDAQDVFAQRRGTNAQQFRVYNTFTDASNYERLKLGWNSSNSTFDVRAEAAGTGTQRSLDLSGASIRFLAPTGTTVRWNFQMSGTSGSQLQVTQATAPTCSSNCGTSPSVAGTDTAGIVTMGASGVPASGWVVTFNGTWSAAPSCIVQMAKAGMVVGKMPLTVVTTTTTMTVVTNGTAPATTDVYAYHCIGV